MSSGDENENQVNRWQVQPFTMDDNPHGLLEESAFKIMFPKAREGYFQEILPYLTKKFAEYVKRIVRLKMIKIGRT